MSLRTADAADFARIVALNAAEVQHTSAMGDARLAALHALHALAAYHRVIEQGARVQAFHDRFGFLEVGTQWLDGGAKQVSLQVATLD